MKNECLYPNFDSFNVALGSCCSSNSFYSLFLCKLVENSCGKFCGAFMRSGADDKWEGLARNLSPVHPKGAWWSWGRRSCGSSTLNPLIQVFTDLALCLRHSQKMDFTNPVEGALSSMVHWRHAFPSCTNPDHPGSRILIPPVHLLVLDLVMWGSCAAAPSWNPVRRSSCYTTLCSQGSDLCLEPSECWRLLPSMQHGSHCSRCVPNSSQLSQHQLQLMVEHPARMKPAFTWSTHPKVGDDNRLHTSSRVKLRDSKLGQDKDLKVWSGFNGQPWREAGQKYNFLFFNYGPKPSLYSLLDQAEPQPSKGPHL